MVQIDLFRKRNAEKIQMQSQQTDEDTKDGNANAFGRKGETREMQNNNSNKSLQQINW